MSGTASASLVGAAREIAAFGVRVIPLYYGKRFPTLHGWPQKATTDAARLDELFADARTTGVGIVTGAESGVFALDVDPDGFARLDAFELRYGRLSATATVATRRGVHLYFRHPSGVRIPSCAPAPRLGKGLDVKAAGGMCAAPPTPHANGFYSWLRGLDELADAPRWLLSRVIERPRAPAPPPPPIAPGRTRAYAAAALAGERARIASAPVGARETTTFKAACAIGSLVGSGEIVEPDAEAALLDAARGLVDAGFTERQAASAVHRGIALGRQRPRRRATR